MSKKNQGLGILPYYKRIIIMPILAVWVGYGNMPLYAQTTNNSSKEPVELAKSQDLFLKHKSQGDTLRYAYPDSAMNFYQENLKIGIQQDNSRLIASSLTSIGSVWAIKNNYDSAVFYTRKSLHLNEMAGHSLGIAEGLNSMGLIEMQAHHLESASDFLFRAADRGRLQNDSSLLSKIYNNLGLLYKRRHNFDSALYYYHESLKLKEELNDIKGIGSTTNNIALIYEEISEFELALQYLNQSLKIRKDTKNEYGEALVLNNLGLVYENKGEYITALKYYRQSLQVMLKLNKKSRIAILYNNMGSVYVKRKDYKNGYYYLKKGLDLNEQTGNLRGQIHSNLDIAEFFENLRIYQNAIVKYQDALTLSTRLGDITLNSDIYEGLYNSYQYLNRYDSALYFYKKYTQLNDSIFNTYSKRNIEKLEIDYQTLKKEKENQDLIRQNQIKEEKLKRLLLVGGIMLVILTSIIVFSIFSIRSRQKLEKTYQLVLEQRNDIQTQSHELKQAYEKLQEFSNFKEELTGMIVHDLKNPLNIILNVSKISNYPDKDQMVQQSGKQMLNLVMNILDVYKYDGKTLQLHTREQYINPLIEKVANELSIVLSEKSIRIRMNIDYDFKVRMDANAIERVIVNLLTNAIKFSPQGSVIHIQSEAQKNKRCRLHIIDMGEGISGNNIENIFNKFEQREMRKLGYTGSTGIGLTYCKMAVEAHGGIIGVNSEPGKGADFYVELDYLDTKDSEIIDGEEKGNYLLLSRENRRILYPHISVLKEKNIYEVTDIRNILRLIGKNNRELVKFCQMIENSVLNCNQIMFDELLELALNKD